MICEFALEPDLVATWHDRKEYLFFEEKFGLRTRRIVSAYPKKWRKLVWRAFEKGPAAGNQNAQMRLDALLEDICQNSVKRSSSFQEIPVWIDRAEAEHEERPFHAILARNNPRSKDHVISAFELVEKGHLCWTVPGNPPITRTALDLAVAVAPILRSSRHIVFIDPYFDPTKKRFRDPMAAFLERVWSNRFETDKPQVEIHTSIDRYFWSDDQGDSRDPDQEKRVYTNLVYEIQNRLPKIIPAGKEVRIVVWKQKEQGQKLHNRYILTDVCGVAFGTGLDQNDDEKTSETDDLHIMDPEKQSERWKEYMGNPPAFDQVGPPITISGTQRR